MLKFNSALARLILCWQENMLISILWLEMQCFWSIMTSLHRESKLFMGKLVFIKWGSKDKAGGKGHCIGKLSTAGLPYCQLQEMPVNTRGDPFTQCRGHKVILKIQSYYNCSLLYLLVSPLSKPDQEINSTGKPEYFYSFLFMTKRAVILEIWLFNTSSSFL